MSRPSDQSEYYAGISKILSFFKRTVGSGFLFCACDNQALVREVNNQTLERSRSLNLNIAQVYLAYDEMDNFLGKLRNAAESAGGLILNNMDELIMRSDGKFIRSVNFSRELLIEMERPLLFWLSARNISRVANEAPDLFSRKDRGVVYFPAAVGVTALDSFKQELSPVYRNSEDFKRLELKVALLEKQLAEAQDKGYPESRIVKEIAADLIEAYLKIDMLNDAWKIFQTYKKILKSSKSIGDIRLVADIYCKSEKWDKAIKYYTSCEKIAIESVEKTALGEVYNNIGRCYESKGDWWKSIDYYMKAKEIYIEIQDKRNLGVIYNNIGVIHQKRGEWDKALDYFLQSEKISIKTNDENGLALSWGNICTIYINKKDWDRAFDYCFKSERIFIKTGERGSLASIFINIGAIYAYKGYADKAVDYLRKAERILIETGNKSGLGTIYNNFGNLYDEKGNWEKALYYYFKAENVRFEIGDRYGLAFTWFNIGTLLKTRNDEKSGKNYLCGAGYILIILGMKHEISQMAWALDPLIEEMGEQAFLEKGKAFYENKMAESECAAEFIAADSGSGPYHTSHAGMRRVVPE